MKARAWLLALGAALALTSGVHGQARPPAQKTGPITIYGQGSTGDASQFSITAPWGTAKLGEAFGALTSLPETAPPANLPVFSTQPQPDWKGRSALFRNAPSGGRPNYAYAGFSLNLTDPGSGQNGPLTAGYGLTVSTIKKGYPSQTAGVGELDTVLLVGRQSGPTPTTDAGASDFDGIQANYQSAGDPGYMAGAEFSATRIDPTSYALTHGIGVQYGVIDPFGKNGEQGRARYSGVNRLTFAYGAIANFGSLDRAMYLINSGGTWDDFIYAGSAGHPLFRVKGADGRVVFGEDGSPIITVGRDGGGTFTISDSSNNVLMQCYQGGGCNIPSIITGNITVAGKKIIKGDGGISFAPVSGLPGNAAEGDTYYLQPNHKLYTWDGSTWQAHW